MPEDYAREELERLLAALDRDLADPSLWATPDGYPGSLALCIVDSVYSIGVNYAGVENVVRRYRSYRIAQGGNGDADGALELMGSFEHLGGPEGWAQRIGNKQRTSTRSGILKADAVLQEAHVLAERGVWSVRDLRDAQREGQLPTIKAQWQTIRGQKSGISWSYFLMLARVLPEGGDDGANVVPGSPGPDPDETVAGVKPDRMIKRYVAEAIGCRESDLSDRRAAALVKAAADAKGWDVIGLDHAIWRYESGRSDQLDDEE